MPFSLDPLAALRVRPPAFFALALCTALLTGCSATPQAIQTPSDTTGFTLSAKSLNFPNTYVASPSASLALTLTNTSTAAISVSTSTTATDFTSTTNCPMPLPAQSSCTLWLVFQPTAAGARVGFLSLSDTTGHTLQADLSGLALPNPPTTFSTTLNQSTVFMGASIVQYWPLPINDKGIAGQVTSQMLARFSTDVLGHGYSRVVILGGSNDILQGIPNTATELVANITSMAQLATNAGLEVVLTQLPPSSQVPSTNIPFNTTVATVNAAIKQVAIQNGYLLVDDYTPMANHPEYFIDGLHPNPTGYAVMEKALAAVVTR